MHIHDSPSSLPIDSTSSPSEATGNTRASNKSLTQLIATETLKGNGSEESAKPGLKSIVISRHLAIWNKIGQFFNRIFGKISQSEQEQAESIHVLIGSTKQAIDQLSKWTIKATHAERKLAGKFPNADTVAINAGYLKGAREKLTTAKTYLQELKEHESTAIELADRHLTYDALPGQIQKLEKTIAGFERTLEVTNKLLNIEVAMKDYYFQGTWVNFTKIGEERKALVETLKEVLHPTAESELQQILKKERLNGEDIHQLLKSAFPDLKGYIERLWDGTLFINDRRIQALGQQEEVLEALYSLYKKECNRISKLEKSIYGNKVIDAAYRFFKGKDYLIQELDKVREGQRETYKEIKKTAKFNHEELSWLHQKDLYCQKLSIQLKRSRQAISFLDLREKTANQMNILRQELKLYRDNLTLHAEKAKQTQETKVPQDFTQTQKLKDSIHSTLQEIAKEVKNSPFKPDSLPKKFEEMDDVNQLKTLISFSFPKLKYQTNHIFELIEKLKLHEELNQALKVKERVTPILTEELTQTEENEIILPEELQLPPEPQETTEKAPTFSDEIAVLKDFSPPPEDLPPSLPHPQQTMGYSTESPNKEHYQAIDVEPKLVEDQEEKSFSLAEQIQRRREQGLNKTNIQEVKPEGREALFDQIKNGASQLNKRDLTKEQPIKASENQETLLNQIKKGRKLNKTDFIGDHPIQKQDPYTRIKQLIEKEGYTTKQITQDETLKKVWESLPDNERIQLSIMAAAKSLRRDIEGDDAQQINDDEWKE